MWEFVWEFILDLLAIDTIQAALSVVLIAVVAAATRKAWWARHVVGLALAAYDYAEGEGLLRNLKGHEKLKPFFDRFTADFREKYGRDPSPEERATAVKAMEQQVQKEHSGAASLGGS